MVALYGIPGSSRFRWFKGSKAECKDWLDVMIDHSRKECLPVLEQQVLSNKTASNLRWRSGEKIVRD